MFLSPVNLIENPKINEWLTMVEDQMRLTLASSLARSVKDIQEFSSTKIDPQSYLKWVDSYQVWIISHLIQHMIFTFIFILLGTRIKWHACMHFKSPSSRSIINSEHFSCFVRYTVRLVLKPIANSAHSGYETVSYDMVAKHCIEFFISFYLRLKILTSF